MKSAGGPAERDNYARAEGGEFRDQDAHARARAGGSVNACPMSRPPRDAPGAVAGFPGESSAPLRQNDARAKGDSEESPARW